MPDIHGLPHYLKIHDVKLPQKEGEIKRQPNREPMLIATLGILTFQAYSGNRRRMSSSLALVMPRSVIRPVTSLAGVTSKE